MCDNNFGGARRVGFDGRGIRDRSERLELKWLKYVVEYLDGKEVEFTPG